MSTGQALAWVAAGALAAGALVWSGRRLPETVERRGWALGLVAAALVYLALALARDAPLLATAFEAGGVAVFGVLAALGAARGRRWLAAGWLLHAAWDGLHLPGHLAFAPEEYAWLCLAFDVVAGLALLRRP